MVVVRKATNTPCIPQGSSYLLYLDVSALSRGVSLPIPFGLAMSLQVTSFSDTKVILP